MCFHGFVLVGSCVCLFLVIPARLCLKFLDIPWFFRLSLHMMRASSLHLFSDFATVEHPEEKWIGVTTPWVSIFPSSP